MWNTKYEWSTNLFLYFFFVLFLFSRTHQFPVQSSTRQEKNGVEYLRLNYVTERILASVLPRNSKTQIVDDVEQQQQPNGRPHTSPSPDDDIPKDVYEHELISMLEQKHGKVSSIRYILYYICKLQFYSTFNA